jgi:hypothetical protein
MRPSVCIKERNRCSAHKNTGTVLWHCSVERVASCRPRPAYVEVSPLAQGSVQRALLDLSSESLPVSLVERATRWRETADDWVIVVAAMITDYQCP